MSLGELARPITIYWDLTPLPAIPPEYTQICQQICAIKPLQLHLLDCGPSLDQPCFSILEQMQGTPLAIVLTTVPTNISKACLDRLHNLGLRGLLLRASSYVELAGIPTIRDDVGSRFATGIAFQVNQENWLELPRVVAFCLEHGISSLTLPMQRLYGDEPPFIPAALEQSRLTEHFAKLDYSSLRLTIHDPFLWRAFNPTTPFPGGGCQAANTMLAISPDGTVYPCPTLPLALGNLHASTLEEILASAAKKDQRAMLRETPEECGVCEELKQCRGGCRGRSLVLHGSVCSLDPACELLSNITN